MKPLKVTFIGAGSIGFTRTLLTDLLSVKEFSNIEIAFTDIDEKNLDMVTQLCNRDIRANGLSIQIQSTTQRRQALRGANYVINCARIGGLEAFESDVDIPLKYGVDQCVGDTLCAGGIMYGQRGIAAALDFCRDIRQVCAPGCILLNYANPNAMLTWACNKYGGVPTIGLCHGVHSGHKTIVDALGFHSLDEVDIICAGINHQTWYISIKHQGEDLTGKLLEALERHPVYSKTEKVRIDVLRRFGYFSTESNGHLSEYLPWYRKRPQEIKDWIDMDYWIHGQTAGYLKTCIESRNWFMEDFPNWMKEPPKEYCAAARSHEHGSYIIESLQTGRIYRGHFNVVNRGCISNLPPDAIVEVPGYVDGNGISIPAVGELPLGCAAICNASISVQRLAVEAAVHGDVALLKQAMMLDPLTGAVLNTQEISDMTDEMLIAQKKWLPQYKDTTNKLEKTFRPDPSKTYQGAARLRVQTLEEMKQKKELCRKMAAASEKGDF